MTVFQGLIIGLLQGLTEFLPISSSGHMLLASKILDIELSLGYELIIHLATLLAVVIVLRKDIFNLIKNPLSKEVRTIIVATVPTVIIVFLFKDIFELSFDGRFLPYCFLITALILLISGFIKKTEKKEIGYLDALIIGTVQGFAAFPGISRSGSTISSSVLLKNDRESSAKFSFLISIPIIIGSSIVELIGGEGLNNISFLPLLVSFISAFFSGYFALKFMIKKFRLSFDFFAIYLLALSIFLFLNDFFLYWF